jgi:hypothetical protein
MADVNVTVTGKLLPGEILALEASIVKTICGSGVGVGGVTVDVELLDLLHPKLKIMAITIKIKCRFFIKLFCNY